LIVVLAENDKSLDRIQPRTASLAALPVHRVFAGVGVALAPHFGELGHAAVVGVIALLLSRQQDVQRMMKVIAPLSVEPIPPQRSRQSVAGHVEVALRHQMERAAQFLRPPPTGLRQFFEKRHRGEIADGMHCIQTQGVEMELRLPKERVLDEIAAHVVAVRSVEVEGLAPRRPVSVGEIRGELAEIVPLRPDVVVDHVQHHGEPVPVGGVHQALQSGRASVRRLHGERIHAVVAPVACAGELRNGHEFDGRDAQLPKLRQSGDHPLESARRGKGAHVQLVENILPQRQTSPPGIVPGKPSVRHPGRSMDSVRLPARRRVGPIPPPS